MSTYLEYDSFPVCFPMHRVSCGEGARMKVKGKGQKGFNLCDCFLVVCGFWASVFVWFCYPRVGIQQ